MDDTESFRQMASISDFGNATIIEFLDIKSGEPAVGAIAKLRCVHHHS